MAADWPGDSLIVKPSPRREQVFDVQYDVSEGERAGAKVLNARKRGIQSPKS